MNINAQVLAAAMRDLLPFSARSQIMSTDCVRMTAANGFLNLHCTSMDIEAAIDLPAEGELFAMPPAGLMKDLTRYIVDSGEVDLAMVEDNRLRISYQNGFASVKCSVSSYGQAMQVFAWREILTVDTEKLIAAAKSISVAAAKNDAVLQCVVFDGERAYATDREKAAFGEFDNVSYKLLIPGSHLIKAAKFFQGHSEQIAVLVSEEDLEFRFVAGNRSVQGVLIGFQYPNLDGLKETHRDSIQVNRVDLVNALTVCRRCNALSLDSSPDCTALIVSAKTEDDGDLVISVPAVVTSEIADLKLSPSNVLAIVNSLDGDQCRILWTEKIDTVQIEDGSGRYYIIAKMVQRH